MPGLAFSPVYASDTYRLLEVNADIENALTTRQGVVIKGNPHDEAVMCTANATYAVREVQLSNSLLVCDTDSAIQDRWLVTSTLTSHLEVSACPPRLERLQYILKQSQYSGPENEASISQDALMTLETLTNMIQASEGEIKAELEGLGAFELHGYWRIVDETYMLQLVSLICNNAVANGYSLDHIESEKAFEWIGEGYLDKVVDHCLAWFSTPGTRNGIYALDQQKFATNLGVQLLRDYQNERFRLNEFLDVWQRLVEDAQLSVIPSLDWLKGWAFVDQPSPTQAYISYFSARDLPSSPIARFQRLFAQQRKWSASDIYPYIANLAQDKKKLDIVLLKYTKSLKENGEIFYTAKIK
ncbi:hypothetical protein BZG36_02597 [Bifiguratus adelaidae]|uniref:Sister chromatid cohesion protein DCC1 n=1 Tax=Bifiguratus adelaidae TaxID=1938954 RepID=A0A261Y2Y3_9FUNG|nr:hypothetical protein BZG36_02597 [Bifiguratus adelaidae]